MPTFTLKIDCDNAAFYRDTGETFEADPGPELARILQVAAGQLETKGLGYVCWTEPLRDVSGNIVGHFQLDTQEDR